ncbi:hypothetical protein B0H19DRAFT_1059699 [Mycena capillaripes]|nr:hypothetical protein B0H19DRAFT_1059699 [Mycena capillaripes]
MLLAAPKFDRNTFMCLIALEKRRPRVVSLSVAICICAEQTFTEASAQRQAFGPACSAALDAYLGSPLEESVNREIANSVPDFYSDLMAAQMGELIPSHRLRMW